MTNLISTVLVLLLVGNISLASAQTPKNPICYVCSDGGLSTITRPNTQVPLPAFLNLGDSISCDQIRIAAEVLYLLPEQACQVLDFPAFRVACGCENAWSAAPIAATVATKAPTPAKIVGGKKDSKGTGAPSMHPSTTPSTRPTPAPVKGGKMNNMNGMDTV